MQSTRQAPVGTFSAPTIGIVAGLALAAILVISVALSGAIRIAGSQSAGAAAAPAEIALPYGEGHDTVLATGPSVTETFRRGDDSAVAGTGKASAPAAANSGPRNLRVRSAN